MQPRLVLVLVAAAAAAAAGPSETGKIIRAQFDSLQTQNQMSFHFQFRGNTTSAAGRGVKWTTDPDGTAVWDAGRLTDAARIRSTGIAVSNAVIPSRPGQSGRSFSVDILLGAACFCTGADSNGLLGAPGPVPTNVVPNPVCGPGQRAGEPCPAFPRSYVHYATLNISGEGSVDSPPQNTAALSAEQDRMRLGFPGWFMYVVNPFDTSAKVEWHLLMRGGNATTNLGADLDTLMTFEFAVDVTCVTQGDLYNRATIQGAARCLTQFDYAGAAANRTSVIAQDPWSAVSPFRCAGGPGAASCPVFRADTGTLANEQCESDCLPDTPVPPIRGNSPPGEVSGSVVIIVCVLVTLLVFILGLCGYLGLRMWSQPHRGGPNGGWRSAPTWDENSPVVAATVRELMRPLARLANSDAPETHTCCICLEDVKETAAAAKEANSRRDSTEPCDGEAGSCSHAPDNVPGAGEEGAPPATVPPKTWAQLECDHIMHCECLEQWMVRRLTRGHTLTCPVCRAFVTPECESVDAAALAERNGAAMAVEGAAAPEEEGGGTGGTGGTGDVVVAVDVAGGEAEADADAAVPVTREGSSPVVAPLAEETPARV
eukprot:Rhum_TRINITY_DN14558_c11_g1::Rhum_TRINITY_DN14558_c11_g1_i1::g.101668::m.101668